MYVHYMITCNQSWERYFKKQHITVSYNQFLLKIIYYHLLLQVTYFLKVIRPLLLFEKVTNPYIFVTFREIVSFAPSCTMLIKLDSFVYAQKTTEVSRNIVLNIMSLLRMYFKIHFQY